jgi:SAM-dependent methyltransferase
VSAGSDHDRPAGSEAEDRFAPLAAQYDRWIGWGPRLAKEMPFLVASLPRARQDLGLPTGMDGVLDIGCGTGAHTLALAGEGFSVTGLDFSAAMLEQARAAEAEARRTEGPAGKLRVEWIQGDITDPQLLTDRWFRGVMALGNTLLAVGDEAAVRRALHSMIRLVAPGGVLILQYLNGTRIRAGGRLVIKSAPASVDSPDQEELWLRHHFEAGGDLFFHSYVLRRAGEGWTAEVTGDRLLDLLPETVKSLLDPHFDRVEFFDGLSGQPFRAEESDAVGVRASGRR